MTLFINPVATVPPAWADAFAEQVPGLARTAPVFADLFASARRSLKILAPYVDPTFTGLMAAVRVPVRVVTTPSPGRPPRPNPVLERCGAACDLATRYLSERRDRALLFQMHAKLILADGARAFVGSASLTDCAAHYNFELGLLIEDPDAIARLERLFDFVFDRLAVRAAEL